MKERSPQFTSDASRWAGNMETTNTFMRSVKRTKTKGKYSREKNCLNQFSTASLSNLPCTVHGYEKVAFTECKKKTLLVFQKNLMFTMRCFTNFAVFTF